MPYYHRAILGSDLTILESNKDDLHVYISMYMKKMTRCLRLIVFNYIKIQTIQAKQDA